MTDEPYPYDPPPRGAKFWRQLFPNAGPDRTPAEPVKAKRRDGSECDVMATLGARRRGPVAPDDTVTDWTPWPP